MRDRVGMIGLGIMGSAMSRNLIAAGFTVLGHDVAPAACASFEAQGGRVSGSAAEVAAGTEVIVICLPAADALHQVAGAIAGAGGARLVAETSTFALDDKLQAQAVLAAAGVEMLDCPLSGSGNQALLRDVVVYGSGERAVYDRCLPVFEGFSRAPYYLGPFGQGTRMKFIANLVVGIHTAAAGEAFALARRAGLDPAQTFEMLSQGAAGSRAMDARRDMLVSDTYLPIRTMPLDLWRKDLGLIAAFAAELGAATPMFSAAAPLFEAAVSAGLGAEDTAAVARAIAALSQPRREGDR